MEKKERFVFHDLIIFSELLESINCKLDDTFFAQFHKWPKSDSFWWRFRANEYYKIFQFNLHTLLTWTLLSMSVVEFSTSDMFTSIDDIFCTYLKKKEMCPFFFFNNDRFNWVMLNYLNEQIGHINYIGQTRMMHTQWLDQQVIRVIWQIFSLFAQFNWVFTRLKWNISQIKRVFNAQLKRDDCVDCRILDTHFRSFRLAIRVVCPII